MKNRYKKTRNKQQTLFRQHPNSLCKESINFLLNQFQNEEKFFPFVENSCKSCSQDHHSLNELFAWPIVQCPIAVKVETQ